MARLSSLPAEAVVAACCEFVCPSPAPLPVIRVVDARLAMSAVAAFMQDYPGRRMTVAGVTGTTGKSTVCAMTSRCLHYAGIPNGSSCSVVQKAGTQCWRPALTTPDAPALQADLARMVRAGSRMAVVEVPVGANSMWDASADAKRLLAETGWGWWRRKAVGAWDEVDKFRSACRAVLRETDVAEIV
jgi:UDP-N-acetylmuramyl tripeptide synthase